MKISGFYAIVVLVFSALLIGCSSSKDADVITCDDMTVLNIPDVTEDAINKLPFKNYKIVPLEAKKASLVGSVKKILFVKDHYYVLDAHVAKGVFVFDKAGKFKFRIRKRGRGPGEYSECFDMDVDRDGNILIFDPNHRKTIKYDKRGRFIEEYPLGFIATEFAQVAKDTFAFYLNNSVNELKEVQYSLIYTTTKQMLTRRYLPYKPSEKTQRFSIMPYHFYRSPKSVLFSYNFCDTIFSISNSEGVKAKYKLNFLDNAIPMERKEELTLNGYHEIVDKANAAYKYSNFYENDELFVAAFNYHEKLGIVRYDKQNGDVQKYYLKDLEWNNLIQMMPCGMVDQNRFYGYATTGCILANRFFDGYDNEPLLAELFKEVDPRDRKKLRNPIIITYELSN